MSKSPCVYIGEALAAYGFGAGHPFGPDRLDAFWQHACEQGMDQRVRLCTPVAASRDELARFHTDDYIDRVIRQSETAEGYLDGGDTPAVAGAELQRLVKTITAANQTQIVSTQILPIGEEQGFVRVALKVRLRGTLPAILKSFYDIETDDIYMFLGNVALRDNRIGRSEPHLRQMDAEFDLVAYMPEAS